jgi:hypothetical protein
MEEEYWLPVIHAASSEASAAWSNVQDRSPLTY